MGVIFVDYSTVAVFYIEANSGVAKNGHALKGGYPVILSLALTPTAKSICF